MKDIIKNNIIKKIIISIIVVVILCNFAFPNVGYCSTDVANALADFFLAIPDGVFYVLQSNFLGVGDVKIAVHSDKKEMQDGGLLNFVPGLTLLWTGDMNLPNIKFTPYAIFSNSIPLLNADFFGESIQKTKKYYYFPGYYSEGLTITEYVSETEEGIKGYIKDFLNKNSAYINDNDAYWQLWAAWIGEYFDGSMSADEINNRAKAWTSSGTVEYVDSWTMDGDNFAKALDEERETGAGIVDSIPQTPSQIKGYIFKETVNTENYINIKEEYRVKLEGGEYERLCGLIEEKETHKLTDSSEVLRPIVSKWYNILRSISIIGLLTVLVYIGIRIIISSASQEKAKYKQLLKDWLVGMCLVFVLHYIMSFTMMATRQIVKAFEGSDIENVQGPVPKDLECEEEDSLSKAAFNEHFNTEKATWKCNSVEYIRYAVVMTSSMSAKIAYIIMYIILCIITCVFAFQYLKRVIYLALLTLVAPIIAFTYPLDKMADKKAQGFNMWFKEYVFNSLIQIMHLLLYFIIITSASELAKTNPIYSIIALGCMTTTEKLLRKIFGFGKASTVGAFGGAAGAAVVMSGLDKLNSMTASSKGEVSDKNNDISSKLYLNKESLDAESILMNSFSGAQGNQQINVDENINLLNNQTLDNNQNTSPNKDELEKSEESTDSTSNLAGNSNVTTINNNGGGERINLYSNALNSLQNNKPKQKVKHPKREVMRYVGKNMLRRNMLNHVVPSASTLGHGLVKGVGAVVGGTVGLAAGVASGDMGKTMKYMAAGAYATGLVADKAASGVLNEAKTIKDDYKQGKGSIDVEYAAKQGYKEFKKDLGNKQYLETRYVDADERKEVYKVAEKVTEYGFKDVEDISAIHEMVKKGRTLEQACAIGKMSKKMGDISGKPKARKEWKEHLISKKFNDKQADSILNDVEEYQKQKG